MAVGLVLARLGNSYFLGIGCRLCGAAPSQTGKLDRSLRFAIALDSHWSLDLDSERAAQSSFLGKSMADCPWDCYDPGHDVRIVGFCDGNHVLDSRISAQSQASDEKLAAIAIA